VRNSLALLILIAVPCWSQTAQTGKAETSGYCSPAVSGSNNQFTITCQNIPNKLSARLVDLLNRVAKNQSDAEAILSKLDSCLEGVKQVRDQAAPWNITEDQKKELKKLLVGTKARFEIDELPDKNASLFGEDLASVLEGAGWRFAGAGLTTDLRLNPAFVGVVLVVNHADFHEAGVLQSALSHVLGIKAQGRIDTGKFGPNADDMILIQVGGKPETSR
jgi:hypothetical protein